MHEMPGSACASGTWTPQQQALCALRQGFADLIPHLETRAEEYRVDCFDIVDAEIYTDFVAQMRQSADALASACRTANEGSARHADGNPRRPNVGSTCCQTWQ